jgi:hypothetical protein
MMFLNKHCKDFTSFPTVFYECMPCIQCIHDKYFSFQHRIFMKNQLSCFCKSNGRAFLERERVGEIGCWHVRKITATLDDRQGHKRQATQAHQLSHGQWLCPVPYWCCCIRRGRQLVSSGLRPLPLRRTCHDTTLNGWTMMYNDWGQAVQRLGRCGGAPALLLRWR